MNVLSGLHDLFPRHFFEVHHKNHCVQAARNDAPLTVLLATRRFKTLTVLAKYFISLRNTEQKLKHREKRGYGSARAGQDTACWRPFVATSAC
ncbi:hypothetical protein KCP73_17095 [Salmonella enterica subsp. enterica]|nr:hypothetical protein KCP73_17095 [Salmonella enterica subsp. enterica]